MNKEDNPVYLEVKPVKQTVQKNSTDDNGNQSSEVVSVALDPENDWNAGEQTCLFAQQNVITAWS